MFKKTSSFTSVGGLQSRTLKLLYNQISVQQQLTQRIKNVLPEVLANQVLHCILKKNHLLIYTPSANWASQLRFYGTMIIDTTANSVETISTVQIKIVNKPYVPTVNIRKANVPSIENIEFLRANGVSIAEGSLKASLLKLSNTLTRVSNRKP